MEFLQEQVEKAEARSSSHTTQHKVATMSRSALWRQEANVKERQRKAAEVFTLAIEEGRTAPTRGQLPLVGPDDSFNLNPMLLHNISISPYFQKCYNNLKEWSALVDEIYYEVKHMEPWSPGAVKSPSTAFCLLVRLFTLRCTEKQMKLMLDHVDSPYIRCIGFLYLRYAVDPTILWGWMEPYLYDDEPVQIASNPSRPESTVGEYVRQLLTEMDYYGTLLPRLPVQIERDIKVKLLEVEQIEQRAKSNLADRSKMEYFRRVGSQVRALYGDDENSVTWYDAVVDRILTRDDATGETLVRPKFIVTFPEYGNTETVSLGEIDLRGGGGGDSRGGGRGGDWRDEGRRGRDYYDERDRGRGRDRYDDRDRSWDRDRGDHRNDDRRSDRDDQDRNRGYGRHREDDHWRRDRYERDNRSAGHGRSRSRSRNREPRRGGEDNLLEEVRRREREAASASGKDYAKRPPSLKSSVEGSASASGKSVGSDRPAFASEKPSGASGNSLGTDSHPETLPKKEKRKKTAEELAAIQEKKRKLMSKYG